MVMPVGNAPRVLEKPRIVILIQELPHEGVDLGVCLAHLPCRYYATVRILRADQHGRRDDRRGAGHRYRSDEHHQEVKKVIQNSRKEEVEKTHHNPNQFREATASYYEYQQTLATQPQLTRRLP
jgi:hypothetical protein